jgi:predicted Zn-dependent protease
MLGELSPQTLPIIQNGELKNLLINSRTAKEYGVMANGAGSYEGMRSASLHSGDLDSQEVLKTLDQGIYISNLHYLNWSDIQSGRFTGMTRYACFWVEKGEIQCPIKDLRFDETLYQIFGPGLLHLTKETEITPNTGSYGMRSLGGKRVPGMIVDNFNFTL